MRTSSSSSPRLSVVPKPEMPSRSDAIGPLDLGASPDGTDLSLPWDIARPLEKALRDEGFRLEPADTSPLGDDNIHFHRIRGQAGSGAGAAALLYVDDRRLEANSETTFFYSLCVRVCKQFRARGADMFCIIVLAPGITRFPDAWKQQVDEFADLGVATTIDFHSVGSPARWRNADASTAMQYVQHWLKNVDLKPLADPVTDGFDRRRESPGPGERVDTARSDVVAAPTPAVFISYAHDDRPWYQKLREVLTPLDKKYPGALWADDTIQAGTDWFSEIVARVESAPIVVMLVSKKFLASDFIRSHELNRALEAAEQGQKTILWVYVGKCIYQDVVGKWQAAHDIDKPLDRLKEHESEDQLFKVYQAVEARLAQRRGLTPATKP